MNMDFDALTTIIDDLKYMGRMTRSAFKETLFPEVDDESDHGKRYLDGKWHDFATDPLRFLWSCSYDKLDLLCQYVMEQKGGDQ